MTAAAKKIGTDEKTAPRDGRGRTADGAAARPAAADTAAFRELYAGHRQAVYAIVARMVSGEADREELLQEIFTQVYLSLGRFRGEARLSTWIHSIAVNVTLQHIRKMGRRVRLQPLEGRREGGPPAEASSPAASPEEEVALSERRAAVERALSRLSPKKRIVLVLSDFEGRTSGEIAGIVGASSLTVRTRLFYARREFYRALSGEAAFAGLETGRVPG